MILYSVTVNIDKNVHDEWLDWVKEEHIPAILKTGLIMENKMLKLLTEEEGNPGITYSFQFFLRDLETLEKYRMEFEREIDGRLYSRYRNHLVDFRTVLEVV